MAPRLDTMIPRAVVGQEERGPSSTLHQSRNADSAPPSTPTRREAGFTRAPEGRSRAAGVAGQLTKPRPSPSPLLFIPRAVPSSLPSHTSQPPVSLCSLVFPNFRKGDCRGALPNQLLSAPQPSPTSWIPPLQLPTPTQSSSARPLFLSSSSSSLPVLSLHPSLPAQCTHTLLPPTPRRPRFFFPRLSPPGQSTGPQDLDHMKLWDCLGFGCSRHNQIHTPTHAYTERYTDTHGRNRQTLCPL